MTEHGVNRDPDQIDRLTRFGDTSDEAIAARLKAALTASELSQVEVAEALQRPLQTINNQVRKGRPSIGLMRFFYRTRGIDFNFIINGDLRLVPRETSERILAALAATTPGRDRTTS